jgi:FkbM family methyltransferase
MRPRDKILRLFLGLPVRRPFVIRLPSGARFVVATRMEVWTIKETCLDRDYERGAVRVVDGWTVVDVGAGLGDFTVRVARECPSSTVYAFEPLPESFERLRENVALNGVSNVRAFPEAVAGRPGELALYSVTGLSGQHRTAAERSGSGASISVPATTLADVFERLSIPRCDFLKIDCEGAEYDILLSTPDATLSKVTHIAMEYHDAITPHSHGEIVAFLERRGFAVRTRPSPAWRELGFLYASRR